MADNHGVARIATEYRWGADLPIYPRNAGLREMKRRRRIGDSLGFLRTGLLLAASASSAMAQTSALDPQPNPTEPQARAAIAALYQQQSKVTGISYASISPDGSTAAWTTVDAASGKHQTYFAPLKAPSSVARISTTTGSAPCDETSPEWSPDSRRIALLSDCETPGQLQIFSIDPSAAAPGATRLTRLSGYLSQVRWSPDGTKIAFLFVEKASRTPSPMAAENRAVGVIDDLVNTDVQRVDIVDLATQATAPVTPAGLYVFEYDWSPQGESLAYTAAPPPGDDNWYLAQLYTQPVARPEPVSIYKPKLQIALPRWSPDGQSIAFIEGLMSDEGATGGEIYTVSRAGGKPRNLTPGRASTPSWFSWRSNSELVFTEFVGGLSAAGSLNVIDGKTRLLWQGGETIQASDLATSLSLSSRQTAAFVRTSWSMLPEVWAGPLDRLQQVTRVNAGIKMPLPRSESVTWTSGGFPVQGWILYPSNYDPAAKISRKHPMIVSVHGGPAWISTPAWKDEDFNAPLFTNLGYFVLFPNVRGSYGQGEKFTQANRREWGFGDLDDMIAGVDAVVARYPVDTARVGVIGWSYGASTAMMAVARSHRFRAAVAGAGAVDMLSYYGENAIDKWMIPYFGASVYDDPAAYARCSAITYVKNAQTPTLLLVGERDGEAPPPQSFEFWHALKELNVPTQLVVYPGEGHGFSKDEDRIDLTVRAFAWFQRYMNAD
jgi:dipeptidyl aminopeptidase/acylaminoacyl peptidase